MDAEQDDVKSLRVLLNGKPALDEFQCNLNETTASLDFRIAEQLNLPASRRIIYRSRILAPDDGLLRHVGLLSGDTIYVIASDDTVVKELLSHKEDPLLRGFVRPKAKFPTAKPAVTRRTTDITSRTYGFRSIRPLQPYEDAYQAEKILLELADDPGFAKVMELHGWTVGCLAEMEPDGKVGVDPVCVLGYNTGRGACIHLRLRTDDRKGFRPMYMLKQVLAHELAHNEHSDHDTQFYALMRQIEREAEQLDWKASKGYRYGESLDFAPPAADPLEFQNQDAAPLHSKNVRVNHRSHIEVEPELASTLAAKDSVPVRVSNTFDHESHVQVVKSSAVSALAPMDTTTSRELGNFQSGEHTIDEPMPTSVSKDGPLADCVDTHILKKREPETDGSVQRAPGSHPTTSGKKENVMRTHVSNERNTKPAMISGCERDKELTSNTGAVSDELVSPLDILVSMGFPVILAKVALRENNNDALRAADWLVGLPDNWRQYPVGEDIVTEGAVNFEHYAYNLQSALEELRNRCPGAHIAAVALATVHGYIHNILRHPREPRYRRINSENGLFRDRLGEVAGGLELMLAIGFNLGDDKFWYLRESSDLNELWFAKSAVIRFLYACTSEGLVI